MSSTDPTHNERASPLASHKVATAGTKKADAVPTVDELLHRFNPEERTAFLRWLDAFTSQHVAASHARALSVAEGRALMLSKLPNVPSTPFASALKTVGVYVYRVPIIVSDPSWCVVCVGSEIGPLFDTVVATHMRAMADAPSRWFHPGATWLRSAVVDNAATRPPPPSTTDGPRIDDAVGRLEQAWRDDGTFFAAIAEELSQRVRRDDARRAAEEKEAALARQVAASATRRHGSSSPTARRSASRSAASDPQRTEATHANVLIPTVITHDRNRNSGGDSSPASFHPTRQSPNSARRPRHGGGDRPIGPPDVAAADEQDTTLLTSPTEFGDRPLNIATDIMLLFRESERTVQQYIDGFIKALGVPLSALAPSRQSVTDAVVSVEQVREEERHRPSPSPRRRPLSAASPVTRRSKNSPVQQHVDRPGRKAASEEHPPLSPKAHNRGSAAGKSTIPPLLIADAESSALWSQFLRGATAAGSTGRPQQQQQQHSSSVVASSENFLRRANGRAKARAAAPKNSTTPTRRGVSSTAGSDVISFRHPTMVLMPTAAFALLQKWWATKALPPLNQGLCSVVDLVVSMSTSSMGSFLADPSAPPLTPYPTSTRNLSASEMDESERVVKELLLTLNTAPHESTNRIVPSAMMLLSDAAAATSTAVGVVTPLSPIQLQDAAARRTSTVAPSLPTNALEFTNVSIWSPVRPLYDVRTQLPAKDVPVVLGQLYQSPSLVPWPEPLRCRLPLPQAFFANAPRHVVHVTLEHVDLLCDIHADCFRDAASLKSITIAHAMNLRSIGHRFAQGCSLLERATIAHCPKLQRLGDHFLYRCTSARHVVLSELSMLNQIGSDFLADAGKLAVNASRRQRNPTAIAARRVDVEACPWLAGPERGNDQQDGTTYVLDANTCPIRVVDDDNSAAHGGDRNAVRGSAPIVSPTASLLFASSSVTVSNNNNNNAGCGVIVVVGIGPRFLAATLGYVVSFRGYDAESQQLSARREEWWSSN